MKNNLLIVITSGGAPPPPPEAVDPIKRNVEAFDQELKDAGVWLFSRGLNSPSTANMVRLQHGEVLTTDGPSAEGKEYAGGFPIIKAPDLDAALEWGRKLTRATTLPIEARRFAHEIED